MNNELSPIHITNNKEHSITTVSSFGDNLNIINNPGSNVNFNISVRKNNIIPLNNFRFKLEKYNLVVIDEEVEEYGEFYMPKTKFDLNLTSKVIDELIKYPTLLCEVNENYKKSSKSQKARICKLVSYEILSESIKFKYIVCKEFNQKAINTNEIKLGIPSSEVTNALDNKSWNTIKKNLFKILNLEAEYGKD